MRYAPDPEILEATTESAAPQRDDRVRSGERPAHTGTLHPGADGHLAARFDHASRDTKSLFAEAWIAHAIPIVAEVPQAFARLVVACCVHLQGGENGIDLAGVQLITPLLAPLLTDLIAHAVDGSGHLTEVALGMEQINDLDRPGE